MAPPPQLDDITAILSPYPEFSLFSYYLTLTGITPAINSRPGKTLCVVDNPTMEDLLSHNPSLSALQNILSFHIFHDYYAAADLRLCHEAITCFGGGDLGYIVARSPYERVEFNLTSSGKIRFTVPVAGGGFSEFKRQVKLVKKGHLSVIQITNLLPTLDLLSPSPPAASMEGDDLIRTIYSHGCRSFAAALALYKPAVEALVNCLRSSEGLTIFCPIDEVFVSSEYFRTDLGMLDEEMQIWTLMYHAMPSYQSMEMLRSAGGVARRMETLAIGRGGRRRSLGVKTVEGEDGEKAVVVETPAVKEVVKEGYWDTRVMRTLVKDKPLALYAIEGVLL